MLYFYIGLAVLVIAGLVVLGRAMYKLNKLLK